MHERRGDASRPRARRRSSACRRARLVSSARTRRRDVGSGPGRRLGQLEQVGQVDVEPPRDGRGPIEVDHPRRQVGLDRVDPAPGREREAVDAGAARHQATTRGGPTARPAPRATIASVSGGATSRTRRMPSRLLRTAAAARGRSPTSELGLVAGGALARAPRRAPRRARPARRRRPTRAASSSAAASSASPSDAIVAGRARTRIASNRTAPPPVGVHVRQPHGAELTEQQHRREHASGRRATRRRPPVTPIIGIEHDRERRAPSPRARAVAMITARRRRCTRAIERYVAVTVFGIAESASSCSRCVAWLAYAGPKMRRISGAPSAITIASGATMRSECSIIWRAYSTTRSGCRDGLGHERHADRDADEVERVGDRPRLVEVRARRRARGSTA